LAERDDKPTAFFQLRNESWRHFFRRTGDQNLVKGGVVGCALGAIADQDVDIAELEALKCVGGTAGQGFDNLYREDLPY
jgi:hypothetical protein